MIGSLNAEIVATTLGRSAHKSGGGFMCCCPAHEDKSPSLSIDDSDTGLLVKCFAGCSQDAVVSALKMRDLWPDTSRLPETPQVKPKVVAKYEYHDAADKVLYWKERLEPGKSGRKKDFRFRYTDPATGKNEFGHGKHNPHVLYNLPAVLKAMSVIIVEGERLVDILAEWRLVGTTLDA